MIFKYEYDLEDYLLLRKLIKKFEERSSTKISNGPLFVRGFDKSKFLFGVGNRVGVGGICMRKIINHSGM